MFLEILTPGGYRPFSGITKSWQKVVDVKWDGGSVKCTAKHLFVSPSGAAMPCMAIRPGDFIKTVFGIREVLEMTPVGEDHVYDVVNVADGNLYYVGGALSHNCEFLGSSDTLISGSKLQHMVHKTPIREENDGAFLVYADPVEDGSYVATVDTAEGVGLDYSVCTVIDVTQQPYRVVAKYRSNIVPPLLFAKSCFQIMSQYNEAVAVVESNNSSGALVTDELWNTYEYENMITTKAREGVNKVSGAQKSIPGIRTTARTKSLGCSSLKSLVESDLLLIDDFDMIHELSTFCLDATGKSYKASKGKNDDTAMTLVLFGWFANEPYFAEMVDLNVRQILRDRLESASEFDMLTVYFNDGIEGVETVETLLI